MVKELRHVQWIGSAQIMKILVQGGVNPFRTAVPFRGQTTQISSSLSPKRDCGSEGVNIW